MWITWHLINHPKLFHIRKSTGSRCGRGTRNVTDRNDVARTIFINFTVAIHNSQSDAIRSACLCVSKIWTSVDSKVQLNWLDLTCGKSKEEVPKTFLSSSLSIFFYLIMSVISRHNRLLLWQEFHGQVSILDRWPVVNGRDPDTWSKLVYNDGWWWWPDVHEASKNKEPHCTYPTLY